MSGMVSVFRGASSQLRSPGRRVRCHTVATWHRRAGAHRSWILNIILTSRVNSG
jgi:hypothetical protein